MRFIVLYAAVLGGLFFFQACEVFEPVARRARPEDLRIQFRNGGGYGSDPIYSLDVYDTGLLVYEGIRFTDRPGRWERSIDRRSVVALLDSFERADFPNYPRAFRNRVADAPTTDITYTGPDGRQYPTSYSDYAPQELGQLTASLRRLANLPGYRRALDTVPALFSSDFERAQKQEIIVRLAPGVDGRAWAGGYAQQGVRFIRRLSPNGDYYLYSTDPNLLSTEALLDRVRADESVISAQMNKPVGIR